MRKGQDVQDYEPVPFQISGPGATNKPLVNTAYSNKQCGPVVVIFKFYGHRCPPPHRSGLYLEC